VGQGDIDGFSDDATKAMAAYPRYWLAWYTAKSFILVAALAYIGYLHGKGSRR